MSKRYANVELRGPSFRRSKSSGMSKHQVSKENEEMNERDWKRLKTGRTRVRREFG